MTSFSFGGLQPIAKQLSVMNNKELKANVFILIKYSQTRMRISLLSKYYSKAEVLPNIDRMIRCQQTGANILR
jgi:hypothetical protein